MVAEVTEATALGRLLHSPVILPLKARFLFRTELVVTYLTLPAPASALAQRAKEIRHRFIVPIAGLDRASLQSLAYARSISRFVTAAHVAMDEQEVEEVQSKWERLQKHLAPEEETYLVVIESPVRSLLRPLLAYIDTVHAMCPHDTLTVIPPALVRAPWWE